MWECAIEECRHREERVEDLLVHQATAHERHACEVCGAVVPDGYFAIRHVFEEHGRAAYVRAYGADTAEIREREEIREAVVAEADLQGVIQRIEGQTGLGEASDELDGG